MTRVPTPKAKALIRAPRRHSGPPPLPDDWDCCLDCGCHTADIGEYYMVQDEVWLQAVPNQAGMLCIGCLETRLGRELTPADFTGAPINLMGPHSQRLLSRLVG